MNSEKVKKRIIEFGFLAIIIFQIFLLLNLATAESFLINQAYSSIENKNVINKGNKLNNLFNLGINLLIGFLTIKQIGTVSAKEIDYSNPIGCCMDTCNNVYTSGETCNDGSTPRSTSCDKTNECKIGCCISSCASNSPKGSCENNSGIWDGKNVDCGTYSVCEKHCCVLGDDPKFVTESECGTLSNSRGLEMDFDTNIDSETECIKETASEELGACVLESGGCRFTTENDCVNNLLTDASSGFFRVGLLCSDDSLDIGCEKQSYLGCIEGKDEIYWFDSCDNPENIYSSDKDFSWNNGEILSKKDSCDDGAGNINSETCGNCDSRLSSICSSTTSGEISVEDGDYVCKNMGCRDENDNIRQHGESWCYYDSFIGNSSDLVGSEHIVRKCFDGEIINDVCGEYRSEVCAEKIQAQEDGSEFSFAQCRPNFWTDCSRIQIETEKNNQNEEEENRKLCENHPDCRVLSVNVDKYFKFDVCVPHYPKGFDLDIKSEDRESNEELCGFATQTCKAIKQKKHAFDDWDYVANKKCKKSKVFVEEMNEFCVSLGDCGGYINIEEEYTKNFEVKGNSKTISDEKIQEYITNSQRENVIGENTPQYINNPADGRTYGDFGTIIGKAKGDDYSFEEIFVKVVGGVLIVGGSTVLIAASLYVASAISFSTIGAIVLGLTTTGPAGWIAAAAIVIGAGLFYLFTLTGKTKTKKVTFTCLPWNPPAGGDDCEQCQDGDPLKPCTKYRCESLGTACGLINEDTDNPICIDEFPDDITPPVIKFKEVESGYKSSELNNGIEIRTNSDSCIQEHASVMFSLDAFDENGDKDYARCMYDLNSVAPGFDNIQNSYSYGDNYYSLEHDFSVTLPAIAESTDVLSNIQGDLMERTGELDLYFRCQDPAGNYRPDEYVVNFCIKEGPDPLPPVINGFEPEDRSFLKYGETNSILTVYLNKPAECRYEYTSGIDYDSMNEDNEMTCEDYNESDITAEWSCLTQLQGLTQNENRIYIRCKNQPWLSDDNNDTNDYLRIANSQDRVYTLYATENPLEIDSISPVSGSLRENPVSYDDPLILEVETSGGADDGVAVCSFSSTNSNLGSAVFFETDSTTHTQEFNSPVVGDGDYNVDVTCVDDVGNSATETTQFTIKADREAPIVVRAYHDGNYLKIITDEEAGCYYSTTDTSCSFSFDNLDIISSMTTGFSKEHRADWDTNVIYYIKCKDFDENSPSGCNIEVLPSEI